MNKIITFFQRFLILNKRILKKKVFLFILLLIPLSVASLAIASTGESGLITIAITAEDFSDPTASMVIDDLTSSDSLIHFIVSDSPGDAIDLVESGEADGAWIFPEDMEEKIEDFANFASDRNSFVLIVQREDSVFLKLSHEKLNSTLYPYISLAFCKDYIYDNILTVDEISAQTIKQYYNSINAEGEDLFQLIYASGGVNENAGEENYLLSPARGLMAILVMLGGLAAAMFYTSDESRGIFDRMPNGRCFAFAVEYHAVAVFDVAVAAFIAILVGGISVSVLYELISILFYITAVVGSCMLFRLVFYDIRVLASITPALAIIMAVVCPIFITPPNIPILQYLLPPFYYLKSIHRPEFLGYMAIFSVITHAASYLLYRIRTR